MIKTIFTGIFLVLGFKNLTAQNNNPFKGIYEVIDESGNKLRQTIEIFYRDNAYYFQAEGAEAYKTILSEDGKELRIKSEESGIINSEGVIEINLDADVRLFYENDQLIYEMAVSDLGTYRYVLHKL